MGQLRETIGHVIEGTLPRNVKPDTTGWWGLPIGLACKNGGTVDVVGMYSETDDRISARFWSLQPGHIHGVRMARRWGCRQLNCFRLRLTKQLQKSYC